MAVEIVSNNGTAGQIGVANGTWFELCNGPLLDLIGPQSTNDSMEVDKKTALACADQLNSWEPPKDWFRRGAELEGKWLFQEFFRLCGGFTTH